jgi:hypothetical protein
LWEFKKTFLCIKILFHNLKNTFLVLGKLFRFRK